jgi:hypothetical protein
MIMRIGCVFVFLVECVEREGLREDFASMWLVNLVKLMENVFFVLVDIVKAVEIIKYLI